MTDDITKEDGSYKSIKGYINLTKLVQDYDSKNNKTNKK